MYIYCVYITLCVCIILCTTNVYAISEGNVADAQEYEKSNNDNQRKPIKVGPTAKLKEKLKIKPKGKQKQDTKEVPKEDSNEDPKPDQIVEPKPEPEVVPDPVGESNVDGDMYLNRVELNISNNYSTATYEYIGKKKHCTFKAKIGYGFSRIKTSGKSRSSVAVIWTAKDESELLTEVVSTKYFPNTEDLVMKLPNGTVKKLVRYFDQGWIPIDVAKINSVTINIDSENNTFAYFNYYFGDHSVFEAKEGFVFDGLVECDSPICKKVRNVWKAQDQDHYLKKVTISKPERFKPINHLVIVLLNDKIKHLARAYRRWIEVQPSVDLDISLRKSNFYFDCWIDKETKFITFVPKAKFLFKAVKFTEKHLSSLNLVEIWDTKNPKEYSRMVMVVPFYKELFLIIFLVNGKYKLFNKCDRFIYWMDHTNHVFSHKCLVKVGINLNELLLAKKPPKLEPMVPIERPELQLPQESLDPLSSRNYQPVLTKLLESSILSRPRGHIPLPKPQGRNLIYLDITQRSHTIGYTISFKDNKVIFLAHPGFLFHAVMNGNEILWKYRGLDYPNKVLYKKVDGRDKIKVYFPEDSMVGPPDVGLDRPAAHPRPKIKFNPYDIQVDVVSFKKPDKKPDMGPSVTPISDPSSQAQSEPDRKVPKPPQMNN